MTDLKKRYEKLLGEPFEPAEKRDCLRINTLTAPKDILKRIEAKATLTKVPFLPYGYWYESKRSLGATPEYLLGYYYLQEAASQLPALVLNPPKHATVLDMTASPGSKTTQVAAMMENTGVIIAVEQKSNRMEALAENLERCSVMNAILFRKDARFIKDFHKQFTHILLDAPCSGNYVIEKDYFKKKTLETIHEMVKIQRELLKAAVENLAPGGTLVYSTCSLEPEENEEQIDWLLTKYPQITLTDTKLTIGEAGYTTVFGKQLNKEIKKTRRLWPQKTGTQAFFIAKLVRE
jgi:NOL1/NOP2/sun family putative RNA methylase